METAITTLSDSDVERVAACVVARLRAENLAAATVDELLTCEEFAARLGGKRGVEWVQDRCRTRKIKTVAGRRPYLIPASELRRVLA